MNKIKFVAISLIAFLTFSSCSSDEVLSPEEISEQLFKTYQLKRDINGAYSLDIIVEDNISITTVKNPTNNTNKIHSDNPNTNNTRGTQKPGIPLPTSHGLSPLVYLDKTGPWGYMGGVGYTF